MADMLVGRFVCTQDVMHVGFEELRLCPVCKLPVSPPPQEQVLGCECWRCSEGHHTHEPILLKVCPTCGAPVRQVDIAILPTGNVNTKLYKGWLEKRKEFWPPGTFKEVADGNSTGTANVGDGGL